MICHNCKKYYDCLSGSGLTWPCGAYQPKTITNADRIRAMTDEELAKWLCSIMTAECCDTSCPGRETCSKGHTGLLDWIKQPAGENCRWRD